MSRPSKRLYIKVSNLEDKQIMEVFSKYGEIDNVNPLPDFSFVEFKDVKDAETALRELNGTKLGEHSLLIEFARDKRDKPTGGCFNCGYDDHWAKECPNARGGPICWRCQGSGHLAKDCTVRSRSRSPYGRGYDRYRRSPSPRRRYDRYDDRDYRRSPPRYRSPPRGYPPRGYSPPPRGYGRSRSPPYRGPPRGAYGGRY